MKLLSPSEGREKARSNEVTLKNRITELQGLIVQKYKELAQAEADFNDTLTRQRKTWSEEEKVYTSKVFIIRGEIEALEERRRQALIPLTKRAEELDTKASALAEYEKILKQSDADIADKAEMLVKRLDEVAERELQADKVAKNLAVREDGVKAQAAQVATGSVLLTEAMTKASQESAARERELSLKEASVKAKETQITERERKVNEKEAGFANRELAIKDQYEALRQAIEETNKKYGTKQAIQRNPI